MSRPSIVSAATGASDSGPRVPDDHVIVLFGAGGDLSRRKLLPGLFRLAQAGLMPDRFRIIGTSRRERSDDDFRALARTAIGDQAADPEAWQRFSRCLSCAPFRPADPAPLEHAMQRAERELAGRTRRLYYLSVPPGAAGELVRALGDSGLCQDARVILEKPFGTDLDSARRLNELVHDVFTEQRVFRIDHFLGREAVQNLIALRFANGMFEPIWNRSHIDHVQIDVPDALSEESRKVFRAMEAIHPEDVVRGQYDGYREEAGVDESSQTETFVAARVTIENWRWTGVPFFLRTGKRLAEQQRLLTIAFRAPPRRMFEVTQALVEDFGSDHISFNLGANAGISASFLAKVPGPNMRLGQARMHFSSEQTFGTTGVLEPYERLMYDAMIGDRTLFTDAEGIEQLWSASAPLLHDPPRLHRYAPGSWGPEAMHELIAPRRWRLPTT